MEKYRIYRLQGFEFVQTSFCGGYEMINNIIEELNKGNTKFVMKKEEKNEK